MLCENRKDKERKNERKKKEEERRNERKKERERERKKVKICLLDHFPGLFCALPFCGIGKTHSNS